MKFCKIELRPLKIKMFFFYLFYYIFTNVEGRVFVSPLALFTRRGFTDKILTNKFNTHISLASLK